MELEHPEPLTPNHENLREIYQAFEHLNTRVTTMENAAVPQIQTPQFPSAHSANVSLPKIALPKQFDGTVSAYRDFMASVRNIFAIHAPRYPTDEIKCRFVGSLLTGDALSWFRYLIETDSPLLTNFEAFVTDLAANYDDPHAQRHAQDALKRLKQGNRSAVTYAARFRRLANLTGYNSEALIEQFRSGLNDEVKDVLATALDEPEDLETFVHLCIKIDNRTYSRKMEKSNQSLRTRQFHKPTVQQRSGPSPMEIDTVSIHGVGGKTLSPQELQRRRDQRLCLYCGGANHVVATCPKKNLSKN
jgi:Retrotransposon gag protein